MESFSPRNINFDFLERRVSTSTGIDRAFALVDLSEAFFASRQFDQALAAMTAAADVFRIEGDDHQSAYCLRRAVSSLVELERWEEAIDTAGEAKTLCLQLGLKDDVAVMDQELGSLYWTVGRIDEALQSYQSAKHHFSGEGIHHEAASCAYSLGDVYAELHAIDCALIELDIAQDGFKKAGCEECQAEVVFRRAELLFDMENLDASAKSFRVAKRMFKSVGNDEFAKIRDDRLKRCKQETSS